MGFIYKMLPLFFAVAAMAEELSSLMPVVVTGKEFNRPYLAGTNTGLGSAVIDSLGAGTGTYDELLVLFAGAYPSNSGTSAFSIRGLNQDNVFGYLGTSSNSLINVMIDGSPQSPSTLRYLPPVLWDISGAVLFRGPQSLLQGPNTMGGALLLSKDSPGFDSAGKALAEISEDGGVRAALAQDFTLLPEELALRISYTRQQSDARVTNLYDQDEAFGETCRDKIEMRVRWHPKVDQRTTFDFSWVKDRLRGNPFALAVQRPGGSLFDRETSLNTASSYPADRQAVTLNAQVILPNDLELKSTTSGQWLDVEQKYDLDASALLNWTLDGFRDETRFSQDLYLVEKEGDWQWLLGFYAEHSEYGFGSKGIGFQPLPAGSPFDNAGSETVEIAALYGRVNWKLTDDVHLSGGLRLSYEKRALNFSSVFGAQPTQRSSGKTKGAELLPHVGLSWQPDEGRVFGVELARGYRGGGTSYAPSLGLTQDYDPEYAWEAEIFARVAATDKLEFYAALFYTSIEDQQVPLNVPGGLARIDTLIENAATASRRGAELEARWRVAEGWTVFGNFAWIQAEFDSLILNGVNRSGQDFPNAPEWIASIGLDYSREQGWFGSVVFAYSDHSYSEVSSPEVTALEARQLLSARIGYAWRHWSVYVYGSNLFDDSYALVRLDNSGVGLPVTGKAGAPRFFGLGAEFKW
jgi:outer membrane receptor protein involved in Fe transport